VGFDARGWAQGEETSRESVEELRSPRRPGVRSEGVKEIADSRLKFGVVWQTIAIMAALSLGESFGLPWPSLLVFGLLGG